MAIRRGHQRFGPGRSTDPNVPQELDPGVSGSGGRWGGRMGREVGTDPFFLTFYSHVLVLIPKPESRCRYLGCENQIMVIYIYIYIVQQQPPENP